MSEIRKNLRKEMANRDMNAYDLSEASGVPQPTIQRFLSGKHGEPRVSTIEKLAKGLKIDKSKLLLTSTQRPENKTSIAMQVSEIEPNYKDGPLISIKQYHDVHAAMGAGLLLPDNNGQITGMSVDKEWINKNVPANTGSHNLRIVTGFGDSMKGMFNSGDPLLVDSGVKEIKYDGVYFFRVNDEGFIKRLQRIPGNGIIVISCNKEYRDWTITNDMDFEIFGRVLKVWNGSET